MFVNAILAASLAMGVLTSTPMAPAEDSSSWNCATQGNHICGPAGGAPAGLYRDGQLIQPWTNYEHPELDPLYGVLPGEEYLACWIEHKDGGLPDESLYGDTALMPAGATPIPCGQEDEALEYGQTFVAVEDEFGGTPGGAVCGSDEQCAAWSRAHGEEPAGYAAGK